MASTVFPNLEIWKRLALLMMVLGHYAQGHYAQGNYAQTEITPKRKLRPRKLSYSKRTAAIIFRLLFGEVYIFGVWLGRFAK